MMLTQSRKRIYVFLCVIGIGIFGLVSVYPESVAQVRKFFSKGGNGLLALKTIQKEITDSGKLIAGIDFPNGSLTQSGVYTFTNSERTQRGLRALGSNAKLDTVAQIRMKDMFANQYFEHVSPKGDSASKEADTVQYEYISLGENIALGNFKDDNALVQAWMNSPGHRANILNSKFTEIGIAVGKGKYEGRQTWIAVQVFGKPSSACPHISETMKASIDSREQQIRDLQNDLEIKKQTLDGAKQNGASRRDYNALIDTYNAEVSEVNALIAQVKTDVAQYNATVQAFNACLGQTN